MKESAYKVKNFSMDAVVACVLGGIAIVCMLGAMLTSYLYQGRGPAAVGLLGIASLIMAVSGLVFSVCAWKSVDGGISMKRIAMVLNAVPLIIALILYIIGWI